MDRFSNGGLEGVKPKVSSLSKQKADFGEYQYS